MEFKSTTIIVSRLLRQDICWSCSILKLNQPTLLLTFLFRKQIELHLWTQKVQSFASIIAAAKTNCNFCKKKFLVKNELDSAKSLVLKTCNYFPFLLDTYIRYLLEASNKLPLKFKKKCHISNTFSNKVLEKYGIFWKSIGGMTYFFQKYIFF